MDTKTQHLLEPAFMVGALLLVSFLAPATILRSAVQLFCLLYATHSLAPSLAPRHTLAPALCITLATLLGLQSILQTIAYYLGIPLGLATDIGTQTLSLTGSYAFALWKSPHLTTSSEPPPPTKKNKRFHSLFKTVSTILPALTGAAFIIYHANRVATVEAIRTPWSLLPPGVIAAYLLIVGSAWLAAARRQSITLVWSLSALFFASLALLTPLVYPLGFGFDGFLHRASEHILLTTGTLTPKPLYYIGQYVLTTWLARTLTAPLTLVDIFLLVGSLALLPATLALRRYSILDTRYSILLPALALLIPLKPWISTTPQSFAYLIGLSALFLAEEKDAEAFFPSLVLGLWGAVIHPLAGLPLLGATLLCLWQKHPFTHARRKKIGTIILALGTVFIVPAAFFFIRNATNTQATWHLQTLFSTNQWHALLNLLQAPATRISLWADWSAFVEFLFPFVLAFFAFLGNAKTRSTSSHWLTATAVLLLATTYLMQQIASFTFLIDYERQDYTQRLFLVGELMLLPAALHGLAFLWERLRSQPALPFYGFLIFITAWQGARIYRAFPYHDATHIEHGWNTSQNDQEAVRWIERDSNGSPYTVLANQAVSAAAIETLGFKRYANDVFFYPIPTGGRLYQVFLRAASINATYKDIETAARLGQSSLVYLVLNDYWWQASEVADRLKPLAQDRHEIDRGAVRIYKFDLNKDKKR